jgi:hypothetical protein
MFIFTNVEVKIARIILRVNHERVALLEWIDSQSIWSRWAEVTHLEGLLYLGETFAVLIHVFWGAGIE